MSADDQKTPRLEPQTMPPAAHTKSAKAGVDERLQAALKAMQFFMAHHKDLIEVIKRFAHEAGLKDDTAWMQAHIGALEAVGGEDQDLIVAKIGHAMGVVLDKIKKNKEGCDAVAGGE